MGFLALEVAVEMNRELAAVVPRIETRYPELADQIRRAAWSVVLNLAEGGGRSGRDRLRFFRMARGSALELEAALELCQIWATLGSTDSAMKATQRVCALTTVLVRGR